MPGQQVTWWLWENYIGIQTAVNHGALFGLGRGYVALFALLSILAAAGIVYWLFVARAAQDFWLTVALGAIMGGILGNLYDRLGLWGGLGPDGDRLFAVRDWILLCYGRYTWPNFNVADSLLVCGAALLMWHAWQTRESSSQTAPPTADVSK